MHRMKTGSSPRPTTQRGRAKPSVSMSKHAEELMELAVEAAQSRHLPDFLEQFAQRSTRMVNALWGGVAVYRGRETEIHCMPGGAAITEGVANWLISSARASQGDVETRALPKEIAAAAFPEEPEAVGFVRIAASDMEQLGTLCRYRKRKT